MNAPSDPKNASRIRETSALIGKLLHIYNNNGSSIARLLNEEPGRYAACSREACGLLMDFSRCALDGESMTRLVELARSAGVSEQRERMFAGEPVNFTENRAVLHPLWRNRDFDALLPSDEAERLREAVEQLGSIASALRDGRLPGDSNDAIRHVVHIGIGGSLLGPRMLVEAWANQRQVESTPKIHFLSSVDPGPREALLGALDPAETAVIVVSKSFTTSEVMTHAGALFAWQEKFLSAADAGARRFAVTSRADRAAACSIPAGQVLEMGEWTGGRFSLWSPVGLTAAIAMGVGAFERLLRGGAAMDDHFRDTAFEDNLPVLAALLDVWHRNVCGLSNLAVIPYDSRLAALPGWLQQVAMESNGKRTGVDGKDVDLSTSPAIFGDCGTDAQHSFFQALHQGTNAVPVDFIGAVNSGHADAEANARLLSHMLAQATALARGRSIDEVRSEMEAEGASAEEIERLASHRVMPGNRPSTVIMMDDFSPETLGALLVFYEHRVFVQSVIWGINAFDQWGVELGKKLAGAIEPAVAGASEPPAELSELRGLLAYIRNTRN